MKKNQSRRNRRILLAGLVAALAAAAAALVLAPTAFESTSVSGLSAYVVATNPGPLPSCSGADCTSANLVMDYVHVVNRNRPVNEVGSRLTVPNSFVVDSIDESVFVNGVHIQAFDEHWTPPPNITPTNLPGYSRAGLRPSSATAARPAPTSAIRLSFLGKTSQPSSWAGTTATPSRTEATSSCTRSTEPWTARQST